MIGSNYHTHCSYCDGKQSPEQYAAAAVSKGFTSLGFSSHSPLPFPTPWNMRQEHFVSYVAELRSMRERYKGILSVSIGVEADFLGELKFNMLQQMRDEGIEYLLGAVHMLEDNSGDWIPVDGPESLFERLLASRFKGNIRLMVGTYYGNIFEMTDELRGFSSHFPCVVAHLDVIKRNNGSCRFFSEMEPWYRELVLEALRRVKAAGLVLEVNSGGLWRKRCDGLYPSPWIIGEAHEMGIPVILGSDAHSPEGLDGCFEVAIDAMRSAGYRECWYPDGADWRNVAL